MKLNKTNMGFIFELMAAIFGEFLFGTVCKFTGAFLLWLFYGMNLDFSLYFNKDDDDEFPNTSGIGCIFYIFILVILSIL